MKKKLLTLIILFLGISRVYAAYRPDYIHGMNEAFEDENFYACVSRNYNGHSDQYLTDEQLASITYLYCSWNNISSTKGLEKLTGLTQLSLSGNQLTSIDVSENTTLTDLNLNDNQLTNIDVSNNTALQRLNLENNQLTSIDASKNTSLQNLDLENNQLTSIDVSKNTFLKNLDLRNNQLTSIDVSKNIELEDLRVDESVEVIGATDEVRIEYAPMYLFKDNDLKFNDVLKGIEDGVYEYTITVGNNISKLITGVDDQNKGYSYNCEDEDTLCGGYYLTMLIADSGIEVTMNDKKIDVIEYAQEIYNLLEEKDGEEYPRQVYKDDELVGTWDENNTITIYRNGEIVYYADMSRMKFYIYISDLNVGNNVLKLTENENTITINIIRSEKEIEESNPSEEFNEIIESIVKDNKVDTPVEDKTNDILSIVPNTGILLSVSLSVVAIILIGLMYYKYYKNKENNKKLN